MESCTAIELLLEIQNYMLSYIGHVSGDYNYDFLLSKDELDEVINYLESALRKAKALAEGLDNYDTLKDSKGEN